MVIFLLNLFFNESLCWVNLSLNFPLCHTYIVSIFIVNTCSSFINNTFYATFLVKWAFKIFLQLQVLFYCCIVYHPNFPIVGIDILDVGAAAVTYFRVFILMILFS